MHLEERGRESDTEDHRGSQAVGAPISHGKGEEVVVPAPAPQDTNALSLQPPKHQGIHSGFSFILRFAKWWQKTSEKPS